MAAIPPSDYRHLLEHPSSSSDSEDTQSHNQHHLQSSLKRLETFLRFLGFCHNSPLTLSLSSLTFLLIGIAAPSLVIVFFYCSSSSSANCKTYHVKTFEIEILIGQVSAAGVSLLCVSRYVRKYGLTNFLFVDKCFGSSSLFQDQYVRKIDDFFRLLAIWVLPCLCLKTIREFVRVIYVGNDSMELSVMNVFILLVSWVYSATTYLCGSMLFNLVCNLQVIHIENYKKLLERDLDVLVYIEEHARLTFHLSKISHRFRYFLILEFLIVTASQFVALLETTGDHDNINFINAADFAISSIVQVVGIIICLHAAAKISNRAKGLVSFASKWHAQTTCNSNETTRGVVANGGNVNAAYLMGDFESADYELPPSNMEHGTNISSYQKRQAFVQYLQSNPGGVTIFGWTVDRALMDTIFSIELSVVTFVLGKTISFSTRAP